MEKQKEQTQADARRKALYAATEKVECTMKAFMSCPSNSVYAALHEAISEYQTAWIRERQ